MLITFCGGLYRIVQTEDPNLPVNETHLTRRLDAKRPHRVMGQFDGRSARSTPHNIGTDWEVIISRVYALQIATRWAAFIFIYIYIYIYICGRYADRRQLEPTVYIGMMMMLLWPILSHPGLHGSWFGRFRPTSVSVSRCKLSSVRDVHLRPVHTVYRYDIRDRQRVIRRIDNPAHYEYISTIILSSYITLLHAMCYRSHKSRLVL